MASSNNTDDVCGHRQPRRDLEVDVVRIGWQVRRHIVPDGGKKLNLSPPCRRTHPSLRQLDCIDAFGTTAQHTPRQVSSMLAVVNHQLAIDNHSLNAFSVLMRLFIS